MKILHAAVLSRFSPGIVSQMLWEHKASRMLGLNWDVKLFCPAQITGAQEIHVSPQESSEISASRLWTRGVDWLELHAEYHQWLQSIRPNYDALLLRYQCHDPFQWKFARNCDAPIFFVHHTLETPELSSYGILGNARALLDHLIGKKSFRRATGLVGVTQEIATYEQSRARRQIPVFVYPNGILYSDKVADDRRGRIPEFLFVASQFSSWHGLDLLLKSANAEESDFVLHIVGNASRKDHDLAGTDRRIRFHGELSHADIQAVAASCHVGVSSLALDRKKMREACTLKVREYLMMGLPVYTGHLDVFPDSFDYYRMGPATISNMISFAHEVSAVAREDVSRAAQVYVNKAILLERLSTFISATIGGSSLSVGK